MENKYYDLIISLIKEHRKYSDYESIVDKIAEDVYKHAETVLETVEDIDTVTSYLKKVIATSMITVPKKLNLNSRNHACTNVETIIAQAMNNHNEEVVLPENKEVLQSPKAEEISLINSSDELHPAEEDTYEEDLTSALEEGSSEDTLEEDLTPDFEEDYSEDTLEEDLTPDLEEDYLEDTIEEDLTPALEEDYSKDTIEEDLTPDLEEDTVNTETKDHETLSVDKTLVDNMINGLPAKEFVQESKQSEFQSQNSDYAENSTELYDELDLVEPTEDGFEIKNTDDEFATVESDFNETGLLETPDAEFLTEELTDSIDNDLQAETEDASLDFNIVKSI